MKHEIVQGDTQPYLRVQLIGSDGNPFSTTGWTITFDMSAVEHVATIDDGAVTIIDATTGVVEYRWGDPGATANAGRFKARFVAVNGAQRQSFPGGEDSILVIVGSRLDI